MASRVSTTSNVQPVSAIGRRPCPWWRRRSGHRRCTDSAAPLGYAREYSPAPPGLWRGSPDCGSIGSAGSSLASPGRVLALPSKSRPAGCPRDPLFSNHAPLTTVNCGGTRVYARVQEEAAQRATPFSPLADVYARFLPAQMLSDLLPLIRSWSPDVLVQDPMEFAGCMAAECLGIPHAACGPLFMFWQGAWHDTPGELPKLELEPLRCAHGLPPDPALAMLYRYLYLAFLPPPLSALTWSSPLPSGFSARSASISLVMRGYPPGSCSCRSVQRSMPV